MRGVTKISLRFRSLFRRDKANGELNDELKFHLDREIQENYRRNVPGSSCPPPDWH